MINLDEYVVEIEEFIQNSIEKFQTAKGNPNSIGIYCCPWSGWMSTNFNLYKTLTETKNNCPDFQYVEFDLHELEAWQEEYENNNPVFQMGGLTIHYNRDNGDEELNGLIFDFLKPIVERIKENNNSAVLLQMLDSKFVQAV